MTVSESNKSKVNELTFHIISYQLTNTALPNGANSYFTLLHNNFRKTNFSCRFHFNKYHLYDMINMQALIEGTGVF